jgi:hypothetical protein
VFQGRLLRLGLRLVQAWIGAKEQSYSSVGVGLPTENSTDTLSRAVTRGSLVMIERVSRYGPNDNKDSPHVEGDVYVSGL